MQRVGTPGIQRRSFRPVQYQRDEDAFSKGTKKRHILNAMLTLIMLFGGICVFVTFMAPIDPNVSEISPRGGTLTAPIEGMVSDLVKIEKSEMNLRGAASSSSSSSSSSIVEEKHQEHIKESRIEEDVGSDQGCLHTLPIDTGQHIVPPPAGPVTLVCCQTTKGVLNIAVHKTWAPVGAQRFLDLVTSNFFSSKVGLFRALKGFLIQFGLPGDPSILKKWNEKGHLEDDPSWLPLGPTNRKRDEITRYQAGYMAYAGAGKRSRGTQLIVAFDKNEYLGGGSPWEVPFGQLVGESSFKTLSKIYTGYGEGVSQGKIMNQGNAYLEKEFPELDYITECKISREDVDYQHAYYTLTKGVYYGFIDKYKP